MTHEQWIKLSPLERERLREPAMPAQLTPFLGCRVEVEDYDGETRRFIVGRSTGWKPIYLEIKTRRSSGGFGADSRGYKRIVELYKVR